jgi:hypothetical protein
VLSYHSFQPLLELVASAGPRSGPLVSAKSVIEK